MRDWFKRHLNWTWVIFYTLTLCLAYSLLVYTVSLPPPMKTIATNGYFLSSAETMRGTNIDRQGNRSDGAIMGIPGKYVAGTSKEVIDEEARDAREHTVLFWWWWPVYIIGTILGSRWVLKQKRRSLHWIWLIFLFPPTPLILDNRIANKSTLSDSGQSQTLAVHHSGDCSETHTHSDKTGDI